MSEIAMHKSFEISVDDLSDGEVIHLLELHLLEMHKHSPAESVHALDVDAMHAANLTFWRADDSQGLLAGCAALKGLGDAHVELKSMKVADAFRGQGLGRILMEYLINHAREHGIKRMSLETGSMDAFIPARTLYQSVGFKECAPFANYKVDVNSVCMSLEFE